MRLSSVPPLVLLCAAALLPCPALHAQPRRIQPLGAGGKRVALVVGNAAYQHLERLRNPVNDARAMRDVLQQAGFTTILAENATRPQFEEAVNRFIGQIHAGDVAMFYYSGHAAEIGGENYLAPVDLDAVNEVQARYRCLRALEIVEQMQSVGADLQIVVLDACRNNPFRGQRAIGGSGGLAPISSGKGTLVAYATAPRMTADDNQSGANGLYTQYLLQALRNPGLSLLDVFQQAGGLVQRASRGKQIPWVSSSVDGEFYFKGGRPATVATVRVDAAEEAWALIRDSKEPQDFDDFAREFKDSQLARVASMRATQLRRSVVAPAPPVVLTPPVVPAPPVVEQPVAVKTRVNPADGLRYVLIPPETFLMGCSPGDGECAEDEKPPHPVTISKGFWIGQTEVTQEAYQRVTGSNPSHFKGSRLPVEQVSWNDAQAYCGKIGMRLPTEAEWEYAARAGDTTVRHGQLDVVAWYRGNSKNATHEVAQKQPNQYGLYDMLGNVCEWTADYWDGDYPSAPATDPTGPSRGTSRVLRGSSWINISGYLRASKRYRDAPESRNDFSGFRCAGE